MVFARAGAYRPGQDAMSRDNPGVRTEHWTIASLGDAAIELAFAERIAPAVNERVAALAAALRRDPPTGARDIVEGYCAVTVHVDPAVANVDDLIPLLESAATQAATCPPQSPSDNNREITVPVCYGGVYGPDLEAVARFAGCPKQEVVRRHSTVTYRVYMLGFLPGFAYMASVDSSIAVPRRSEPRLRVPAGSVGIAGFQTGIYPNAAPGGWQLIGRTALAPFDLDRSEPCLFRPGDRVRFKSVPAETLFRAEAVR